MLRSLIDQRAGKVWLWIPDRFVRFPDWDGQLPDVPSGVTILRGTDFGPATKFLPALKRLGPDEPLVVCDDDATYAPGWAEALGSGRGVVAASTFPVARLGLRPRPAPHHMVAQGFAGIRFTPRMLDPRVHVLPAEHRFVDDIWLSAHFAAAGTPITSAPDARTLVRPTGADVAPLQKHTPGGRARANRAAAVRLRDTLGIWA